MGLKLAAKKYFFPGLDLHTRCRYRFLADLIRPGALETLDAGFGNGALSLAAHRKGNRVLGVSWSEREVRDTREFFEYVEVGGDQIELRLMNIYDLRGLSRSFDQIVCSETLEHIQRDREVVQMFADLLRPGGRLVLCCPHARHPEHALGRTNEPETGGHVRDGYTMDSYRALLEPAGLVVRRQLGLGSPLLIWLDRALRGVRHRVGDRWAFPLFLLLAPMTWIDYRNPKVPFSLAVVAEKPA